VVIASDFLVDDGGSATSERGRGGLPGALDLLAALRHRAVALHLDQDLDPLRPPTPRFEAVDAETGERIRLEATAASFREYRRQADAYADAVRSACRRHGFTYARVAAHEPFDEVVLRLLRERGPLR
jgi:hypothetical protein